MYNKLEIDKNLKMLRKCTDECLAKLAETTSQADVNLLEQRIETTLALADFFVDSVKNHLSKTGGMNLPHLENHLIFDDYQKHKVSEASCGS